MTRQAVAWRNGTMMERNTTMATIEQLHRTLVRLDEIMAAHAQTLLNDERDWALQQASRGMTRAQVLRKACYARLAVCDMNARFRVTKKQEALRVYIVWQDNRIAESEAGDMQGDLVSIHRSELEAIVACERDCFVTAVNEGEQYDDMLAHDLICWHYANGELELF